MPICFLQLASRGPVFRQATVEKPLPTPSIKEEWVDLKRELYAIQERICRLCPQCDLFALYVTTWDKTLLDKDHLHGICPLALPLKEACKRTVTQLGTEFTEWLEMARFLAKPRKEVPCYLQGEFDETRSEWDSWGIRLLEHILLHLHKGMGEDDRHDWKIIGTQLLVGNVGSFLSIPRNSHGTVHFASLRSFIYRVESVFEKEFPTACKKLNVLFEKQQDAKCLYV